jgi:hypothetical protein
VSQDQTEGFGLVLYWCASGKFGSEKALHLSLLFVTFVSSVFLGFC